MVLAVTVTAATAAEGSGCWTGPFWRGRKWDVGLRGKGELGGLLGAWASSPERKKWNVF